MRILAVDPGVNTGWCYRDGSGHIEGGTQVFDLRRGESAGMRFLRFNQWLRGFNILVADLVLYEQAHHRGGPATEVCVGMTTRLMEFAAPRRADYKGVHTSTLKKIVTGNGRADKEQMMAAVRAAGYEPLDEHHADALGLMIWWDAGMPEAPSRPRK